MDVNFNLKIGTLYKRIDYGFCTMDVPNEWNGRYFVDNDGNEQQNLIFIFNSKETTGDTIPLNSFTIQYSDLAPSEEMTPQLCLEIEEGVNPGGQKQQIPCDNLNDIPAIAIQTKNYVANQTNCNILCTYVKNSNSPRMYRFCYSCEIDKEKNYKSTFEHMLKSIKIK